MEEIYGESEDEYLFSDEALGDFFDVGGSVKYAAGLAMIAVGNSEAMILKVIKNYETSTNGAVLQQQWREGGKVLIAEAKVDAEAEWIGGFEVIFPFDGELWAEAQQRSTGAGVHVIPPWGGSAWL